MKAGPSDALRDARRTARAEAAAWIVRLHGPHRTPKLETAFQHWLATSEENARQFERVTEVWDTARNVPQGGITRLAQWKSAPSLLGSRFIRAAAAVMVCALFGLVAYSRWAVDVYRTGIGEERLVRLTDGSRLTLNSDTRIVVNFSRTRRHMTLTKGEAYFEVTHDPARPFVVAVGGHDVTALGTSFLVRYDHDRTAVILVDGKVAISAPATPVLLAPGERLVLARNTPPKVDMPHIDVITAWRRGEVILDKTPLDEAVAEMNRYEDEKLVIDSRQVGQLRISGIYHTGDSAGFAEAIAKLYHLRIERNGHKNEIHFSPTPAPDPE
jgi:transmembrane sensor